MLQFSKCIQKKFKEFLSPLSSPRNTTLFNCNFTYKVTKNPIKKYSKYSIAFGKLLRIGENKSSLCALKIRLNILNYHGHRLKGVPPLIVQNKIWNTQIPGLRWCPSLDWLQAHLLTKFYRSNGNLWFFFQFCSKIEFRMPIHCSYDWASLKTVLRGFLGNYYF